MGRPLRKSKTVTAPTAVVKTGVIGDTALSGSQIVVEANISTADAGGTGVAATAIVKKQVGSKRFLCNIGASEEGVCSLVTTAPIAGTTKGSGQVRITATDSSGDDYFVSKINSRKITVVANTGTQFGSNTSVAWSFGTAYLNANLSIASA